MSRRSWWLNFKDLKLIATIILFVVIGLTVGVVITLIYICLIIVVINTIWIPISISWHGYILKCTSFRFTFWGFFTLNHRYFLRGFYLIGWWDFVESLVRWGALRRMRYCRRSVSIGSDWWLRFLFIGLSHFRLSYRVIPRISICCVSFEIL